MFTGIIDDIGTIISIKQDGDVGIKISTNYDTANIKIGASISCSGICLTVMKKGKDWFFVKASQETISCTTMKYWQVGSKLNLERSLKMGDEIGGHLVSGHIDGVGIVKSIIALEESHIIDFIAPDKLTYFIAKKGSIAINGVSLTVNHVHDNCFSVNIIPHSWNNTNFHELKITEEVNLEIDMMARYIARVLEQFKHD